MRGLRSFLALLVVLVALGGYLYFVESKRDPLDTGEKRAKVFTVDADAIGEITVRSESGERTTLKKEGTGWQIVAPEAATADGGEISAIATNLSSLEEQRLVEENATNLADFGLAEPRIEVAFKSGGQEQRLLLGSKTPTGGDVYAKTAASPRVFLIASYLESTFNRTPFDLRDKTALAFNREAADAIEIVTPARTLSFAKKNGEWQIVNPAATRADGAAIEGLLARLNTLQMKGLPKAGDPATKAPGLDKPAATVRVGAGSAQATLLVGGPAADGTVYAKDASRPAIFTIEAAVLEDLQKGAGDYRQKDVFDARAFNTTRLEITRGANKRVFEKKDAKWHETSAAAKEADAAKIDALLSALTSARADTSVDTLPAGAKPELTVALGFDEGRKQETVSFLRSGGDAFAQRAGTPGAAKLPPASLDAVIKALEDVK